MVVIVNLWPVVKMTLSDKNRASPLLSRDSSTNLQVGAWSRAMVCVHGCQTKTEQRHAHHAVASDDDDDDGGDDDAADDDDDDDDDDDGHSLFTITN